MSEWTVLIGPIADVLHLADLITDLIEEEDLEYHVSPTDTQFDPAFTLMLGRFDSTDAADEVAKQVTENQGYEASVIMMPELTEQTLQTDFNSSRFVEELNLKFSEGVKMVNLLPTILDTIRDHPDVAYDVRRAIFTTFKDSAPELAIPLGIEYSMDNEDPRFLSVLITRLMRNESHKEALDLLLHRLSHDGECTQIDHLARLLFRFHRSTIVGEAQLGLEGYTQRLAAVLNPIIVENDVLHRILFTGLDRDDDDMVVRLAVAELYQDDWATTDDFMRESARIEFQRGNFTKAIDILHERVDDSRAAAVLRKYKSHVSLLENGWFMPPSAPSSRMRRKGLVRYIAYTSIPYHSSGYATRTHNLIRAIQEGDWSIEGVTRYGYPWTDLTIEREDNDEIDLVDGVTYHRQPNIKAIHSMTIEERLQESIRCLIEHCVEFGIPEILHAASNWMNGIVACHAGRILGIPVIYEVRGRWELTRIAKDPEFRGTEHDMMIRRMEVEAANSADHVLVITEGLKQMLIDEGVDSDKITVAPNGVDGSRLVPILRDEDLAHEIGVKDGPVIGYVGSLVHYEGLDLLLRAVASLNEMGLWKGQILIVGDGAERRNLERLARESGISESCIFTGRVDFREINRYYSLIDIAPFPRTPADVCEMVSPLKPFEAMAMGKTVICSDVAALQEIIENGVNGLLFEKGDLDSLTGVLAEALEAHRAGDSIGEQAREWVLDNRTWVNTANIIETVYSSIRKPRAVNVLIAGHDLKFIDGMAREMIDQGFNVLEDKWVNHTRHHVVESRRLLAASDVVICEWSLGNAAWYSRHIREDQKLFIRFHRQEIETEHPFEIIWDNVEHIIFIAPLVQREACARFQIPDGKAILIPNAVDTSRFDLPKTMDSKYTLGLMGMVPKMKRFDRALDILGQLNRIRPEFILRVKGKMPQDYSWMEDRTEEMAWYEAQMMRLEEEEGLIDAVIFDGWGDDVPEWLAGVGFILSVSDFEGSHQAVAEGASSGAFPIIVKWPGADEVYPAEWCLKSTEQAVEEILATINRLSIDNETLDRMAVANHIRQEFSMAKIVSQWANLF